MLKTYSLSFIIVFLSHDIIWCMEQSKVNPEELPEKCSICLEFMSANGPQSCKLPDCLHQFHRKCITSSYNNSPQKTCPLCRTPYNLDNLIPLPLNRTGSAINRAKSACTRCCKDVCSACCQCTGCICCWGGGICLVGAAFASPFVLLATIVCALIFGSAATSEINRCTMLAMLSALGNQTALIQYLSCKTRYSQFCTLPEVDDHCITNYAGQPYVGFIMSENCAQSVATEFGWPGKNITGQYLLPNNNTYKDDIRWFNFKHLPQESATVAFLINATSEKTYNKARQFLYNPSYKRCNQLYFSINKNDASYAQNYIRLKQEKIFARNNKQNFPKNLTAIKARKDKGRFKTSRR